MKTFICNYHFRSRHKKPILFRFLLSMAKTRSAENPVPEENSDGLEIISIGSLYKGPWDKKYWSSSRVRVRSFSSSSILLLCPFVLSLKLFNFKFEMQVLCNCINRIWFWGWDMIWWAFRDSISSSVYCCKDVMKWLSNNICLVLKTKTAKFKQVWAHNPDY